MPTSEKYVRRKKVISLYLEPSNYLALERVAKGENSSPMAYVRGLIATDLLSKGIDVQPDNTSHSGP